MKNIAFVYSGVANGLESLQHNRNTVSSIFSTSSLWEEPINRELKSLKEITSDLKLYKDETIDNLLFFYTGHGAKKGIKRDELHLELEDDKTRNIQEVVGEIFEVFKGSDKFPNRIAIVLDACYSGTLIENNNPFTGSFEILTSAGFREKGTEKNDNSTLSLFTDAFCEAIENLTKGSKEVTLYEVSRVIKGSDYTKESGYSYPRTKNGMMTIVEHNTTNLLENLTKDLKVYFQEHCNSTSLLEAYTKNLLDFSSKTVPNEFDEIVKYLFEKHKQILISLLVQLDDSTLDSYIDDLLKVLRKTREDIKSFASMKIDMFQQRSNLLITLKPNGKNALGDVEVQIFEYKQGKVEPQESCRVDLTKESGKTQLVDTVLNSVSLSRRNVLLEFIVPFELLKEDISSWKGSEGRELTAKIVKRLQKRIETIRVQPNIQEEWKDVWSFYRNRASLPIDEVMTDEIDFDELEDRPYVRLTQSLSFKEYHDLIKESACIVLAPLKDEQIEIVNSVCQSLEGTEFRNLLKESSKKFKKAEVPYLLIWDNPNRLPLKKTEIKNNQYKSVVGA
ncbi:MAG: caspase family protein [Epsilonproteobacteria bacterium]|nr:caspase family protein [Campylobacterota bacterium]